MRKGRVGAGRGNGEAFARYICFANSIYSPKGEYDMLLRNTIYFCVAKMWWCGNPPEFAIAHPPPFRQGGRGVASHCNCQCCINACSPPPIKPNGFPPFCLPPSGREGDHEVVEGESVQPNPPIHTLSVIFSDEKTTAILRMPQPLCPSGISPNRGVPQ